MLSSLSSLLTPRSSCETSRSQDSQMSTRSYRLSSDYYTPPSIFYGSQTRPNIELQKPVWEVNHHDQNVTVSGEIEVDMSMFRRGKHILPFSIGIHFTVVKHPSNADNDSDNTDCDDDDEIKNDPGVSFRGEWNQDGPGNYYRTQSFIQIDPRTIIDDTTSHVQFSIFIPPNLIPAPKTSRVYNVAVKAYELGDPYNVTEPSAARFMVLNRVRRTSDRESTAMNMDRAPASCSSNSSKRAGGLASQMNFRIIKRGGPFGRFR
ncbi:hypothetical protein FRB94_013687 [Tulasnella sp. JGI-2019a]|nr:hypothetical protein FRB93_011960 [Tulasnella sp. JGI-2019a]KAG9008130.1 hypothetical protein FRB94_013687 [Tulasnella sp. JGI-2019a]KAG9033519.1 hypothetical protein FRB95_014698 [Tulasnella sp. JGI-2019a]